MDNPCNQTFLSEMRRNDHLHQLLERKYREYNSPDFIPDDPVSVPHEYNKRLDIEIVAFWTAVLSWGQRKTIVQKARELFGLMDNDPYAFITGHKESDLVKFRHFKHRTFNEFDTLYFIDRLKRHYENYSSLEDAFLLGMGPSDTTMEKGLIAFHRSFFDGDLYPLRTKKHVSTPAHRSACKRLNMFLRWMVRRDGYGVDFGLWKKITPAQLVAPCDVHVERVARQLGLIKRKSLDWSTALELTAAYRRFDADDPVKYDFAVFGMGLESKF